VPPGTGTALIPELHKVMRSLVLKLRANCKSGCKSQKDTEEGGEWRKILVVISCSVHKRKEVLHPFHPSEYQLNSACFVWNRFAALPD
jgi:hypothetical protein